MIDHKFDAETTPLYFYFALKRSYEIYAVYFYYSSSASQISDIRFMHFLLQAGLLYVFSQGTI